MKNLFLIRWLDDPAGAENSLITLYHSLEGENLLAGYSKENDSHITSRNIIPRDRILPFELNVFGRYLEATAKFYFKIKQLKPDRVFTQHEGGLPAVLNEDVEVVYFLRDETFLHKTGFEGRNILTKIPNGIFSKINRKITSYVLSSSDYLIANSEFTKNLYEDEYGIEPEVIYPFVDIDKYEVESTGEKILHVNPQRYKGIELTLDIAEQMPEQEFILAGKVKDQQIQQRIESLDNVEVLGYLDDMTEAYSQTKIVLMPSKWEEPYGRIPIEAGASGIPTIGCSKGGIPESVGKDDLVIDSRDLEEYIDKIKEVEANYEEYSSYVRENASRKSKERQIRKLNELMSNLSDS